MKLARATASMILLANLTMSSWPSLAAHAAEAPPPPVPSAEEAAREGSEAGLPREVVEKLSAAQLVEVLKKREQARVEVAAVKHGKAKGLEDLLIPLGFFACLILLVALPLYFRLRKDRDQQATLRLMIEKGVSIPVEFLAQPARRHTDLRRGVLLVAAGLGLAIFLKAVHAAPGAWSLGVVPFLIGAGHLVVWRLVARSEGASPPASARIVE
jgi:hypothetical protein